MKAKKSKRPKKPQPDLNDWMSTGEFGLLVGRHPKIIRIWIEEGFIPASCVKRLKKQYRIRRLAEHCLGDPSR